MNKKKRNTYFAEIELDVDELENIFQELDKAKETIYDCYSRLGNLGFLTIKRESTESERG